MNKEQVKANEMIKDYNQFIKKYGLPLISADDLRYEIIKGRFGEEGGVYSNHEHIFPEHDKEILDYLNKFIDEWESLDY